MIRLILPLFFLLFRSAEALSAATQPGKWSEMAIQTANELTQSARQQLCDDGVMDIQRPVRIIGAPIQTESSGDDKDTKILHFQRHGQGFHNVLCEQWRELTGTPVDLSNLDPAFNPMLRLEVLDSPLTEVGRQQCRNCREKAAHLNPELVLVSPLLRAIQSAWLSWGDHRKPHNLQVPWVAHETLREELGLLMCNKRRKISEIQAVYPDIDFSFCPDNEDTLFMPDRREEPLERTQRVYDFLSYVRDVDAKEIAVIGHSAWLFTMCNAVMEIEDEALKSWFLTSEIRSMQVTFVDQENDADDQQDNNN